MLLAPKSGATRHKKPTRFTISGSFNPYHSPPALTSSRFRKPRTPSTPNVARLSTPRTAPATQNQPNTFCLLKRKGTASNTVTCGRTVVSARPIPASQSRPVNKPTRYRHNPKNVKAVSCPFNKLTNNGKKVSMPAAASQTSACLQPACRSTPTSKTTPAKQNASKSSAQR